MSSFDILIILLLLFSTPHVTLWWLFTLLASWRKDWLDLSLREGKSEGYSHGYSEVRSIVIRQSFVVLIIRSLLFSTLHVTLCWFFTLTAPWRKDWLDLSLKEGGIWRLRPRPFRRPWGWVMYRYYMSFIWYFNHTLTLIFYSACHSLMILYSYSAVAKWLTGSQSEGGRNLKATPTTILRYIALSYGSHLLF